MKGKIKKSKKLACSSYTNEASKAYISILKSKMSKLNLILTISLNPNFPVIDYNISRTYWNKENFILYINNRNFLKSIEYDFIDKTSFHREK